MTDEQTWARVAVFGHFGDTNLGNETTLKAVLCHLRRLQPDADVTCICSVPEAATATHGVKAIPITEAFIPSWAPKHLPSKALRKVIVALAAEPYRWIKGFRKLRDTDVLIVPGTGLLTDVSGLFGWGPHSLFRWSVLAKIARCRVLFVSVGAGPIYRTLGKYLVRAALSSADFRSYRDDSTRRYLSSSIGFHSDDDRVYPDLVFSIPEAMIPRGDSVRTGRRPVAGLGLMLHPGRLSVAEPTDQIQEAYIDALVSVGEWLLDRGYDIRLLIGDFHDNSVVRQFMDILRSRLAPPVRLRVEDTPAASAEELLTQIASCDVVIATRFHNVILSLLCNKPVIAISFHHKCDSLMETFGQSHYCLDINDLRAETLIERFRELEAAADEIKRHIAAKVEGARDELDRQYECLFGDVGSSDQVQRRGSLGPARQRPLTNRPSGTTLQGSFKDDLS